MFCVYWVTSHVSSYCLLVFIADLIFTSKTISIPGVFVSCSLQPKKKHNNANWTLCQCVRCWPGVQTTITVCYACGRSHPRSQLDTLYVAVMQDACWASVEDDGSTLILHWFNGSCLLGKQILLFVSARQFQQTRKLNQCCFNSEQASHWAFPNKTLYIYMQMKI